MNGEWKRENEPEPAEEITLSVFLSFCTQTSAQGV